jgi:hypothetical protein
MDGRASAEAVTRGTTVAKTASSTATTKGTSVAAAKTARVAAAKTTAAVATASSVLGPQRYRQHQRKRRNGHPTAHIKIIIRPHCKTLKPPALDNMADSY